VTDYAREPSEAEIEAMNPPMTPDEEAAYEAHLEAEERDHEEFLRTGRHVCPRCEQRTLKVTYKPTRQYGGGTDSFEQCEAEGCGYAEVYV
jgi:hypothetical protein